VKFALVLEERNKNEQETARGQVCEERSEEWKREREKERERDR
jgi:hypothetical protein